MRLCVVTDMPPRRDDQQVLSNQPDPMRRAVIASYREQGPAWHDGRVSRTNGSGIQGLP